MKALGSGCFFRFTRHGRFYTHHNTDWKVRWVSGYDNIKDYGFDKRSAVEVRKIQSKGGKNSGVVRRQKANFRKMLNVLLTSKIPFESALTQMIESMGIEPTFEAGINLAMVVAAMNGDTSAYGKIAKLAGQSEITAADEREQRIRIDRAKNMKEIEKVGGSIENDNIKAFLGAIKPNKEEIEGLFDENSQED